ncbi:response regulator [Moritella sp.]|uniref:response regulator n=1 Tax=Moritella sp. TaxID=78556 RepID=UPI001D675EEA|nr:response regulator [Moritella sp.]MCJ8348919.1 response regulator [Moritella sp.]NQZ38792.1 response regulator [Moritella sp.]
MSVSVLICDDSNLARKQMAKTLPPYWDVDVSFAANGVEGIDVIRAGKGSIVFLDLNMPVMDGYQVLETIQKEQLNALVIVVSGDIQAEALQRVTALGALAFIKKPVTSQQIETILINYGIIEKDELAQAETRLMSQQAAEKRKTDLIQSIPETLPTLGNELELSPEFRDALQEVANVAMGQAADLLARLLDVFVLLPVPNVNVFEASELTMALSAASEQATISTVCQGFICSGIAGEALLLFHDSSFDDMAKLMGISERDSNFQEKEILMDTANILIGAFLQGFSQQLNVSFSQGHPSVLGQHSTVQEMINANNFRKQKTIAIEINYQIEHHDVQCDLLLLFTEKSLPSLLNSLSYLID